MPPLSPYLGALGSFFGGLGQDQQNQFTRQRALDADAESAQLHGAQMADIAAQADQRKQQTSDLAQKAQANQRAFGTLQQIAPTHPLVQSGFNPGVDYLSMLSPTVKDQQSQRANTLNQRRNFNALKVEYPQLATQLPFDENDPANYEDILKNAREQRKQKIQTDTGDWIPAGNNKDGDSVIVNKKTGETRIGGGNKPLNGMPGSQQAQQARLLAAVSEARLADERMRKFEDRLLAPEGSQAIQPTTISPFKQAAGSLVTNLADSHGVVGALTQAGSEYMLNKNDPEYAQYLRDASTIGRAEQMMSPRGGNETMVRANALLSRAGSGAMKNTIDASRMARQALFGESGGVAQSLSPAQNQKLQQGVETIKAGGSGKQPITTQEYQQLKAMGYTDAQLGAKYTIGH